jgi:hypothetical protein
LTERKIRRPVLGDAAVAAAPVGEKIPVPTQISVLLGSFHSKKEGGKTIK